MTPTPTVVLVCGYSLLLLVIAWALDFAARRSSARSTSWRTGNFVYHDDQDAWRCHEDQWLYPASFDPEKRVIRYEGQHAICGRCPSKPSCSPTPGPREVTRAIDPWPHSEAGRFHRGLSLCVGIIAVFLPVFMLFGAHNGGDVICLFATIATGILASVPLARHLWNTPSNFPEHLPHIASAAPTDGSSPKLRLPIVETTSGRRPGTGSVAHNPAADDRVAARADAEPLEPVSEAALAAARAAEMIDRYSTRWTGDARTPAPRSSSS